MAMGCTVLAADGNEDREGGNLVVMTTKGQNIEENGEG
jgi:hypothetical protein